MFVCKMQKEAATADAAVIANRVVSGDSGARKARLATHQMRDRRERLRYTSRFILEARYVFCRFVW